MIYLTMMHHAKDVFIILLGALTIAWLFLADEIVTILCDTHLKQISGRVIYTFMHWKEYLILILIQNTALFSSKKKMEHRF